MKNQTDLLAVGILLASIPNSVTTIGEFAFHACNSLTSMTIPDSVTSIPEEAFGDCTNLVTVTLGNGITSITQYAFVGCTRLSKVTIGKSLTSIGSYAFGACTSLEKMYFEGRAPSLGEIVFSGANASIYYLVETSGWETTFGGRPTVGWKPQMEVSDSTFGVQTNGFGFTINWASDKVVVVEASTSLINPTWSPIATNALVGGSSYFTDPQSKKNPNRFYRVRSL